MPEPVYCEHIDRRYALWLQRASRAALAASPSAAPLDRERLALHSDDDDCHPPHVHRHHWVDVLYPADKVWFYCTGCQERRIQPAYAEEKP